MQLAWLRHSGRETSLFRAGNRQGKSTVGCAELIFRARGKHPFKTVKAGPVRLALVCFSAPQSVEIQRVLWDLVDKSELKEGVEFSARTGFRGHRPVVEFKNGSSITVYSSAQGAGALAGAEFDYVLLDEPPSQDVFDEALQRVTNTGGSLGLTLTPINGPPLPWLRALCEAGTVVDYHQVLTPESQVSPLTGLVRRSKDGRPWDASFIEELRSKTNPIDAPIRLDGEWESRSTGQFFACFDKDRHISRVLPNVDLTLCLGVDFASADRELGMAAVLSGYYKDDSGKTFVYVLDEAILPGVTSMADFAKSILRMLRDNSLEWHHLDSVFADNPVKSRYTISSALELGKYLGRELAIPSQRMRPKILSAKEGAGGSNVTRRTKDIRSRWFYGELAADRIRVNPRCQTVIKGLSEWDYGDKHPLKDALDACMYGLKDLWSDAYRKGDVYVPLSFV